MGDCLPAWHYQILEVAANTKGYGQWKVKGCPAAQGAIDDVPCRPEVLRSRVEAQLHAAGLWTGTLPLAVYALARNIMSEVGQDATPEEMVAVVEAAMNRQKYQADKWPTIESQLLRNGQWFGKQRGQNPVASTSQDPYFVHFYVAQLVLSGATHDFTRGANVYFDAVTQDAVRRKCLASGKTDCAKSAHDVFSSWTAEGEAYWVGHLPGIDPRHMMLFVSGRPARKVYRAPGGHTLWSTMRQAALAALGSNGPDERKTSYDLPPCAGAGKDSERFRRTVAYWSAGLGFVGAVFASVYFARAWHLSKPIPIRATV